MVASEKQYNSNKKCKLVHQEQTIPARAEQNPGLSSPTFLLFTRFPFSIISPISSLQGFHIGSIWSSSKTKAVSNKKISDAYSIALSHS